MLKDTKKKKSFWQKHYTLTTVVISAALIVVGYVLYVRPASVKLQEISYEEMGALEEQAEDKQKELLRIKRLAVSLEALPATIRQQLNQALPNTPRMIDLLVNIDALLRVSGLELVEIQFIDPSTTYANHQESSDQTVSVKELGISLRLEGVVSYTVLKSLLNNIESNLRLLRIDQLAFDPSEQTISLRLTSFYLE